MNDWPGFILLYRARGEEDVLRCYQVECFVSNTLSGCRSSFKVRLLDGSTITTVFKALEPLAAVRVYVQMNSNVPEGQDFTLLSPYPRHVYTEQDMEKPLKELGESQTRVFPSSWTWTRVIVVATSDGSLFICPQVWCLRLFWLSLKSEIRGILSVSLPHYLHHGNTRLVQEQAFHFLVPLRPAT